MKILKFYPWSLTGNEPNCRDTIKKKIIFLSTKAKNGERANRKLKYIKSGWNLNLEILELFSLSPPVKKGMKSSTGEGDVGRVLDSEGNLIQKIKFNQSGLILFDQN